MLLCFPPPPPRPKCGGTIFSEGPSPTLMPIHTAPMFSSMTCPLSALARSLARFHPPTFSLILPASCCKDQSPKKNAQFVMSCPAVNLPSVSHGEDLLSPIYLFATWTIEGPRPAEFSIIKPPTISPHHPLPSPHPHVNNTRQPAGVTGH